jgi:hypothetical protein
MFVQSLDDLGILRMNLVERVTVKIELEQRLLSKKAKSLMLSPRRWRSVRARA